MLFMFEGLFLHAENFVILVVRICDGEKSQNQKKGGDGYREFLFVYMCYA